MPNNPDAVVASPPVAAAKDPLRSIAGQLSMPQVDMGQLAALRRFHPLTAGRHSVFETQQVLLRAGIDLPADHPLQAGWALIVHCVAIARGAHDPGRDTGATLADLRFSEARLRQLIEADGPLLSDLLPGLARRLAAARTATNWWPLADMALAIGDSSPGAQARAELARRRIVQGFLRATAAQAH